MFNVATRLVLFIGFVLVRAAEQDFYMPVGCKCESNLLQECCSGSHFSALLNSEENIVLLEQQSAPFYLVSPELNRRKLTIFASDVSILLLNITSLKRNESRNGELCSINSCILKVNNQRKKESICQLAICSSSLTFDGVFEFDSRKFRLIRLQCVGTVCGHALLTDEFAGFGPTARTKAVEAEDTVLSDKSSISIDTVWLIVILGGTSLSVLTVVGVVFACITHDRRRKVLQPASSFGWRLRPTPRFAAAVDEFYRAAMKPDNDGVSGSVSASDDDADDEAGDRSSGQRTIKFSAIPTFVPLHSRSDVTLNLKVESIPDRRQSVGTTTNTPSIPVKSILKKSASTNPNRLDAAVSTSHSQNLIQNGLFVNGSSYSSGCTGSVLPPSNEVAVAELCESQSSSSYSLVECIDKSIGVTEADLDYAVAEISNVSGQASFLSSHMNAKIVSHPITEFSPAAPVVSPCCNLPDPSLLNIHQHQAISSAVSVCESCECECDCESQSQTASIKAPKTETDEGDMDAVSLSDLDLFKLACEPTPRLKPAVVLPTYLPNPARLNRLSSLASASASDSDNPSAADPPSPPSTSTRGVMSTPQAQPGSKPKLELRDADLQLSLNIVPAATQKQFKPIATAKAALLVSAGLQRQREDGLLQIRPCQTWVKGSERFNLDVKCNQI